MKNLNKYRKSALITGASEGIGKDFAFELAKQGFSLYLVARNQGKLEEVRNELRGKFDVPVSILSKDLSDSKSVSSLIEETNDISFGIVVLAAGFGSGGEFASLPVDTELNIVDLNCRSIVQLSHHFIKRSEGKESLGLILFGSLVGFQGVPWTATYAASKAFVQSFAEGLYGENRGKGIDVLSVAPGPVNSGFGGRAGMKMGMSQSPNGIAKISLSELGKSATVRPGFLSKFLGYSLSTLPRNLRSLILKKIMASMVFGKK